MLTIIFSSLGSPRTPLLDRVSLSPSNSTVVAPKSSPGLDATSQYISVGNCFV